MANLTEVDPADASSQSGTDPDYSDDEPLLNLTEEDKIRLIEQYAGLRPSEVLRGAKPSSADKPLVVLSPEELQGLAAEQEEAEAEEEEEVEEVELWEEVVNAILWSIPFSFLFFGMNMAAHSQFGQHYNAREGLMRILNFVPALLLLNLFASRPISKSPLPPRAIQALLAALCVGTGSQLINVTTTESFVVVINQAPALGVLWVWSVVRMDLLWALGALVGVAGAVWARGDRIWS